MFASTGSTSFVEQLPHNSPRANFLRFEEIEVFEFEQEHVE